jgi:hypothetical protein
MSAITVENMYPNLGKPDFYAHTPSEDLSPAKALLDHSYIQPRINAIFERAVRDLEQTVAGKKTLTLIVEQLRVAGSSPKLFVVEGERWEHMLAEYSAKVAPFRYSIIAVPLKETEKAKRNFAITVDADGVPVFTPKDLKTAVTIKTANHYRAYVASVEERSAALTEQFRLPNAVNALTHCFQDLTGEPRIKLDSGLYPNSSSRDAIEGTAKYPGENGLLRELGCRERLSHNSFHISSEPSIVLRALSMMGEHKVNLAKAWFKKHPHFLRASYQVTQDQFIAFEAVKLRVATITRHVTSLNPINQKAVVPEKDVLEHVKSLNLQNQE